MIGIVNERTNHTVTYLPAAKQRLQRQHQSRYRKTGTGQNH